MATGTNKTIRDLIHAATGQGMTRAQIADAVGCSRVHLWRLEAQEPNKETALTRRIREALGQTDPSQHPLNVAVRRIAGTNPNRQAKVLQLLLSIEELLVESEEPHTPEDKR